MRARRAAITPSPTDIMAKVDHLAEQEFWPAFDPRTLPVVIYDGCQTWLFRHSRPLADFVPGEICSGAQVFSGLHPAVRANTSVMLNGIQTATVMLDTTHQRTRTELAALVVHELFHVFQGQHRPDWGANELSLFVYPVDDAAILRMRRLETEALHRALSATSITEQARWASAAVVIRRERFGQMPFEAIAYERGNEIKEGLAQYVTGKALGDGDVGSLLAQDFPAGEVRQRTYAVGRAFALLLDHLAPEWKGGWWKTSDSRPLDVLLEAVLEEEDVSLATFTPEEWVQAQEQAQLDVEVLRTARATRREAFCALQGWQLVVTAGNSEPLWPQAFDPMNVITLGNGEVLHTRHLKLGNAAGTLEILGHQVLTEAAGTHPLCTGVRKVTVAGLAEQPSTKIKGDRIEITSGGLTATFQRTWVDSEHQHITVNNKATDQSDYQSPS